MDIEQLNAADTERTLACHQVYLAAHRVDRPRQGWLGRTLFGIWLTRGWGRTPQETWLATAGDGTLAGWYALRLPDQENQHRASLDLTVHPAWRRRGIGRARLEHAVHRAIKAERTVLDAMAADTKPGESFARAAGAVAELTDVCRIQDLTALPPLTQVRAECAQAAAGYSTVSWTGPVPEQYLAGVAGVFEAFGDRPHSADWQPRRWDAQRVRDEVNVARMQMPAGSYAVAALCDQTGEIAGLTEMFTDPDVPDWANQGPTAVSRRHRGHRLGLLLKLSMLDVLAGNEPGVRRIQTWNTTTNSHMIAVNEALGYTVTGPPYTSWRLNLT
jgi:GNAT superfamily N-acetyltransferase/RimJ/RimL family protein N-acetyltransferase